MFTLGDVANILDDALDMGINIVDALHKLAEAGDKGRLSTDECRKQMELPEQWDDVSVQENSKPKKMRKINNACEGNDLLIADHSENVPHVLNIANRLGTNEANKKELTEKRDFQGADLDFQDETKPSPLKLFSHHIDNESNSNSKENITKKYGINTELESDEEYFDTPLETYKSKRWSTTFALNLEDDNFRPSVTEEIISSPEKRTSISSYESSDFEPELPDGYPMVKRKRSNTYSIETTLANDAEEKGLPIIDALDDLCHMADQFINVKWDNQDDQISEDDYFSSKVHQHYSSEGEISPTASRKVDEKIFALDKETARAFSNFADLLEGDDVGSDNLSLKRHPAIETSLNEIVDQNISYIGDQAKVVLKSFEALKQLKQYSDTSNSDLEPNEIKNYDKIIKTGRKSKAKTDEEVENLHEMEQHKIYSGESSDGNLQSKITIQPESISNKDNGNETLLCCYKDGEVLSDSSPTNIKESQETVTIDREFYPVYSSFVESIPYDFQTVKDVTYDFSEDMDASKNDARPTEQNDFVTNSEIRRRPGTYVLSTHDGNPNITRHDSVEEIKNDLMAANVQSSNAERKGKLLGETKEHHENGNADLNRIASAKKNYGSRPGTFIIDNSGDVFTKKYQIISNDECNDKVSDNVEIHSNNLTGNREKINKNLDENEATVKLVKNTNDTRESRDPQNETTLDGEFLSSRNEGKFGTKRPGTYIISKSDIDDCQETTRNSENFGAEVHNVEENGNITSCLVKRRNRPGTYVLHTNLEDQSLEYGSFSSQIAYESFSVNDDENSNQFLAKKGTHKRPGTFVIDKAEPFSFISTGEISIDTDDSETEGKNLEALNADQVKFFSDNVKRSPWETEEPSHFSENTKRNVFKDSDEGKRKRKTRPSTYVIEADEAKFPQAVKSDCIETSEKCEEELMGISKAEQNSVKITGKFCYYEENMDAEDDNFKAVSDPFHGNEESGHGGVKVLREGNFSADNEVKIVNDQSKLIKRGENEDRSPKHTSENQFADRQEIYQIIEKPFPLKWKVSTHVFESTPSSVKELTDSTKNDTPIAKFGIKLENETIFASELGDGVVETLFVDMENTSKVTEDSKKHELFVGGSCFHDSMLPASQSDTTIIQLMEGSILSPHSSNTRPEDNYTPELGKNMPTFEGDMAKTIKGDDYELSMHKTEKINFDYLEGSGNIEGKGNFGRRDEEDVGLGAKTTNLNDNHVKRSVKRDSFNDSGDYKEVKDSSSSLRGNNENEIKEDVELNNNEVKTVEKDSSYNTDYIEMADELAVLSTYAENDCCPDQKDHNRTAGFNFSKEPVEGRVEKLSLDETREIGIGQGDSVQHDNYVSKALERNRPHGSPLHLQAVSAEEESLNRAESLNYDSKVINDHHDPLASVTDADGDKAKPKINSDNYVQLSKNLSPKEIEQGCYTSQSDLGVAFREEDMTGRIALKLEINLTDLSENNKTSNTKQEKISGESRKAFRDQHNLEKSEPSNIQTTGEDGIKISDESDASDVDDDKGKIHLKLEIDKGNFPERSSEKYLAQGIRFDVNFVNGDEKITSPPEGLKDRLSVKRPKKSSKQSRKEKSKERPGTYVVNSPIFSRDEYQNDDAFERSFARNSLGSTGEYDLQDEIKKAIEEGRLELEKGEYEDNSTDEPEQQLALEENLNMNSCSKVFEDSDEKIKIERPPSLGKSKRPGTYILEKLPVEENTIAHEEASCERISKDGKSSSKKDSEVTTRELEKLREKEKGENDEAKRRKRTKNPDKDSKRESLENFKKSFDKHRIGFFVDLHGSLDDEEKEDKKGITSIGGSAKSGQEEGYKVVKNGERTSKYNKDQESDILPSLVSNGSDENNELGIADECDGRSTLTPTTEPDITESGCKIVVNAETVEEFDGSSSRKSDEGRIPNKEINSKVNILINKSIEDKSESISVFNNSSSMLEDEVISRTFAAKDIDNREIEVSLGLPGIENAPLERKDSDLLENVVADETDLGSKKFVNLPDSQDEANVNQSSKIVRDNKDFVYHREEEQMPGTIEGDIFRISSGIDFNKRMKFNSWNITPDTEKEVLHRISSLSKLELRDTGNSSAKCQAEGCIATAAGSKSTEDATLKEMNGGVHDGIEELKYGNQTTNKGTGVVYGQGECPGQYNNQNFEQNETPRRKSEFFVVEFNSSNTSEAEDSQGMVGKDDSSSSKKKGEYFVIGEEFDAKKIERRKSVETKEDTDDTLCQKSVKEKATGVKRKDTFVIKYVDESKKETEDSNHEAGNVGGSFCIAGDVKVDPGGGFERKKVGEIHDSATENNEYSAKSEEVNSTSPVHEEQNNSEARFCRDETVIEDVDLYVSTGSRPASGISEGPYSSTEPEGEQKLARMESVCYQSNEEIYPVSANKGSTEYFGSQSSDGSKELVHAQNVTVYNREEFLVSSAERQVAKKFDRQFSDSVVSLNDNSNVLMEILNTSKTGQYKTLDRQLSENVHCNNGHGVEFQEISVSMQNLGSELTVDPFKVPRSRRTQNLGHRPMSYDIARKPLVEKLEKLCSFMSKSLTKLNTMSEDESEIVVTVDKRRGREDMYLRRKMAKRKSRTFSDEQSDKDTAEISEAEEERHADHELNRALDKIRDLDGEINEEKKEIDPIRLRGEARRTPRGKTYVIQSDEAFSSGRSVLEQNYVANFNGRLSVTHDGTSKYGADGMQKKVQKTTNLRTKKDEGGGKVSRESLAPKLAVLKMQLEEKRRHIEEGKRRMMDQWNEERTRLGQQAFWLAVGKETKAERDKREQEKQAALDAEKKKKPGLIFFPFSDENDPEKVGRNPRRARKESLKKEGDSPPNECSTPVTPVAGQQRDNRISSTASDYPVHQNRVGSTTMMEASPNDLQGETFLIRKHTGQEATFENRHFDLSNDGNDAQIFDSPHEQYTRYMRQDRPFAQSDHRQSSENYRDHVSYHQDHVFDAPHDQMPGDLGQGSPASQPGQLHHTATAKPKENRTPVGYDHQRGDISIPEGEFSGRYPASEVNRDFAGNRGKPSQQQRNIDNQDVNSQYYYEITDQQNYESYVNSASKPAESSGQVSPAQRNQRTAWSDPYAIQANDFPLYHGSVAVPQTNSMQHDNNHMQKFDGNYIEEGSGNTSVDPPTGFQGPGLDPPEENKTTEKGITMVIQSDDLSPKDSRMPVNLSEHIESGLTTLTPEQQKKKEKFIQNRIKRQQEEKAKREAELEKKRRKEEKLKERKAKLETKEREEQERVRKQRQEEENTRRRMEGEEDRTRMVHRLPRRDDQWNTPPNRRPPGNSRSQIPLEGADSPQAQPSSFAEYKGPPVYVKPTGKSNRQIMVNAISYCCLSGEVNKEAKEKSLQVLSQSNATHFFVLFRDGLKFRGLYTYSQEADEAHKIYGVGPKVIVNKIVERLFKYSSGAKSFSQIPAKSLSIQVDGIQIKKECWNPAKGGNLPSKTDSNLRKGATPNSKSEQLKKGSPKISRR